MSDNWLLIGWEIRKAGNYETSTLLRVKTWEFGKEYF
jgi:hypothetical protein